MNGKRTKWLMLVATGCFTYSLGLWFGRYLDRLAEPTAPNPATCSDTTARPQTAASPLIQPGIGNEPAAEWSAFLESPGTEFQMFEERVKAWSSSGRWDHQLTPLIHALAPSDYPAAWLLISGMQGFGGSPQRELVRVWARHDPLSALAAVGTVADLRDRDVWVEEVLGVWASADPDAALDWVRQMPGGYRRDSALGAFIGGLARKDPCRAAELLSELPKGGQRIHATGSVIVSLVGVDIDAATRLLDELGSAKDDLTLRTVAGARADHDVADAVEWAQGLARPQDRESALGAVIHSLVLNQGIPETAAELVMSQSDPRLLRQLAGTLAGYWGATDVQAAAAWVRELPDGAVRGHACTEFVHRSPQLAAELTLSMAPGEGRTEVLRNVLSTWAFFGDVDEANAWSASLPDDSARAEAQVEVARAWAARNPVWTEE